MTKERALEYFRVFMQEAQKYAALIKQYSELEWKVTEWIDEVAYMGSWELKLAEPLDERKIHSKARVSFKMLSELAKNTVTKIRREGCNAKLSIRECELVSVSWGC